MIEEVPAESTGKRCIVSRMNKEGPNLLFPLRYSER